MITKHTIEDTLLLDEFVTFGLKIAVYSFVVGIPLFTLQLTVCLDPDDPEV